MRETVNVLNGCEGESPSRTIGYGSKKQKNLHQRLKMEKGLGCTFTQGTLVTVLHLIESLQWL